MYKENIESVKASLFHLNRENNNFKKGSLESLKIDGEVTKDTNKIEAKVLKYFGALLNGHHDRNGADTGHPFQPDYSDLPDFLVNLAKLSQTSQDNLVKHLTVEQVKFVVLKNVRRIKVLGWMALLTNFTKLHGILLGRIL